MSFSSSEHTKKYILKNVETKQLLVPIDFQSKKYMKSSDAKAS